MTKKVFRELWRRKKEKKKGEKGGEKGEEKEKKKKEKAKKIKEEKKEKTSCHKTVVRKLAWLITMTGVSSNLPDALHWLHQTNN